MKLCPSISRAGIATFPLSNDKSYELCITGRSVCGCSYVEINFKFNHIQQMVGFLSNRVCVLQRKDLPELES